MEKTTTTKEKKTPVKAKAPVAKKATAAKKATVVDNALSVKVYGLSGTVEKEITLPSEIFSAPVNSQLIAQYVRVYLTNQRQGNANTKTRSEVIGSTKKIYRQKGTGRARHGANKAPIFVGGGITFGPKTKDFNLKMNKKQKKLALIGALSQKATAQQIMVLGSTFEKMESKTKVLSQALKAMNMDTKKVLIVTSAEQEKGLPLAARNMANIKTKHALNINAYEVLAYTSFMITETGLQVLVDALQHNNDNEISNS